MNFNRDQIYHIYNQGNNKGKIFFTHQNYLYFIQKIKTFILPYSDILAYCLMPNHFHLLVYVKDTEIEIRKGNSRTFNKSIGTMLSSYTNAINNQEGRIGSLFRQNTKIEDGWVDEFVTIDGRNHKMLFSTDYSYAKICFDYIHNNPVKAGMVEQPPDWPYSSAVDYKTNKVGSICNLDFTKEMLGLI